MKHILFYSILLLLSLDGFTQAPAWIDPVERKSQYPDNLYLTGFSSEMVKKAVNPDELRQKHLGFAKTQLVETIQVNISSSATLNLENLNTESLEHFKQASVSTSEAQLSGLKTEAWYDAKKKSVYAFAYIRIADLLKACKADMTEKSLQLKKKIESGENHAKNGDIEQSLKTFYNCFPLVREMENDEAILVAIGKEPLPEQTDDYEFLINQQISDLRKEKHGSLDDVCLLMADGLTQQLTGKNLEGSIRMGSFTFQDTHMGSEFSARLASSLEQKIIHQGFNLKSPETLYRGLQEDTSGYLLSGTYWKEGENIKIISNLQNVKTHGNIAGVEEFLPQQWCTDNSVRYIADNYDQALVRKKQFSENEITGGGLFADLWTNRGKDNPIFARGDTMRIYVRVDQPCYIRLIYYFSDGTKSLLADSRYLGEDKINKPILLPDLFVCDAPYGAETIQMIAQTIPFKPLTIRLENGYQMILDDVGAILTNVRGMKTIGKTELFGEKRLDLTTLSDK
ncbi:MAG: DUF4384 domain-containing protein [Bacteroidales bacterium]|jgi:hypothetical protein|nr:DUF4384 domain-containing protein [Bacteroidales bacterium]